MARRTIGLYGETGSGKTTLGGEMAKHLFKTERLHTRLRAADMGGYLSLLPLVNLGVIRVDVYDPTTDPWMWVNDVCSTPLAADEGLAMFDSATSISEMLLKHISHSDQKVGAQNTQKFTVSRAGKEALVVGANNQNHYGIVQGFMLDMIWKSTWLAQGGPDVLWTFSTDKGEMTNDRTVIGPKLAGHALTSAIPKWFNYFFRVASVPQLGGPPSHILYIQEQEENGMLGFGNARYPLDATTPLPDKVEPASLVEALQLIEQGTLEAEDRLREELGL